MERVTYKEMNPKCSETFSNVYECSLDGLHGGRHYDPMTTYQWERTHNNRARMWDDRGQSWMITDTDWQNRVTEELQGDENENY